MQKFVVAFGDHRDSLKSDFNLHGVESADEFSSQIDTGTIFSMLHSSKEQDLVKYVEDRGGPEKIKENDLALAVLLIKCNITKALPLGIQAKDVATAKRQAKADPVELQLDNWESYNKRFDLHSLLLTEGKSDDWALQHITMLKIQPLIEAFDDDASTFVTVSEANAFAAARPQDWR